MALQKVDAVIAGVGAIALLATVLGVVFYDELAGEQDLTFPSTAQTLAAQQGSNGAPLQFALPNNATGASLAIDVAFAGQSGQGGNADVTIRVTGPDGLDRTFNDSLTVGANSQGSTTTLDIPLFSWANAPEAVRADPASLDETLTWSEPLTVTVTVGSVGDPLSAIPGGVVNYTFTSTVTPTISVYSAMTETPELETA